MAPDSAPAPHRRRPPPPWGWAIALLVGVLALLLWDGWRRGLLGPDPWAYLYPLVLGGWVTLTLLAGSWWGWRWIWRGRTLPDQYRRELYHLRAWAGEEGRLRKEGLIRDLTALGAAPERLEHALLAGLDLKGANLAGCDLTGAELREADLQGARLDGARLWGADLTGANLTLATLNNANLRGAKLENAELVKVNLTGANLHKADLTNANLYGTDLKGARLGRTRFALPDEGEFPLRIHPSVEDWIRERLDAEGFYAREKREEQAGTTKK